MKKFDKELATYSKDNNNSIASTKFEIDFFTDYKNDKYIVVENLFHRELGPMIKSDPGARVLTEKVVQKIYEFNSTDEGMAEALQKYNELDRSSHNIDVKSTEKNEAKSFNKFPNLTSATYESTIIKGSNKMPEATFKALEPANHYERTMTRQDDSSVKMELAYSNKGFDGEVTSKNFESILDTKTGVEIQQKELVEKQETKETPVERQENVETFDSNDERNDN